MACQKKYFYRLLLLCVALTLFSGCILPPPPPNDTKEPRPIPVTKNIINRVKKDNDNYRKPLEFQYYISKKVTLTLAESKDKYTIESGELIITKRTRRDKITILENLPGLMYKAVTTTDENGYLLEVHFEEKYPNCFIKFRQSLPGDDESYNLYYDDAKNKTIKYGDDYYIVDFDGIDFPYLLIKVQSRDISDSDDRMASGITLP